MMLLMLFIILMPLISMMLLIILMSLMFMMLLIMLMSLMLMMLLMFLITPLMSLMSLMLFFKGELHGRPGLRSRWESASSSAIPGQVGALWLISCTWKIVQKREEGGGGQTHAKNSNEFLDS